MKRRYFSVAAVMLCVGSLLFSSCIGSFALTNKLLSWNNQVGNKFVNELVFVAFWILPVYEVSALADILVINSIEFWSGSNPVAQGRTVIDGNDGRYLVDCDGKGYTITSENDGSVVRLDFDADQQSWSATVGDDTYTLMTFVDDTHVRMPAADGGSVVVSIDQEGLWAYQQMATSVLTAKR
ncbi:MAG: DUF3332 domain-containing protein [Firmicutes bacterium]|nr:DUF3332 domain-containing protein [Bacillota bacterium]MCM1401130.1 DUF3332 domain-containing protein [Bacteroides sp.]MCM1477047.1 DUF3332 domain-containing protein [Bacteroides sp.]